MILIKRLLPALAVMWATICFAQTTLPVPANIQATYTKGTRTATGAPGKNYWHSIQKDKVIVLYN